MLGRLASLIKKFVRRISVARGLSEAAADAAGGKIFTFGSYRLGVHGPGTDIDTLCVVPKHVSREDFFEVLEPMLKETEGVTEVSVRFYPFSRSTIYRANGLHGDCVGSSGGLCSRHELQDIWYTDRFDHGPFGSLFGARRLITARRQSLA